MNEGGGGSSAWRFTEAGRFLLQGEAHADALLMDAPAQSLPVKSTLRSRKHNRPIYPLQGGNPPTAAYPFKFNFKVCE